METNMSLVLFLMAAKCILSTVWSNLFMAIYLPRSPKVRGVSPITKPEGLPAKHISLHLKRSRLPSLDPIILPLRCLHHIWAMNKTCTMRPRLHIEILEGVANAMHLRTSTRFTVMANIGCTKPLITPGCGGEFPHISFGLACICVSVFLCSGRGPTNFFSLPSTMYSSIIMYKFLIYHHVFCLLS